MSQLDPNDPEVVTLIENLVNFEGAAAGLRAHLAANGIMVPHGGGQPLPRSNNPLAQRDGSILPPPNPHSAPPPVRTRWDEPEPAPEPSPEFPHEQVPPIERWQEIFFRPGMAQAMLYVLLPVIEQAVRARTPEEASAAIDQMDAWQKLTMAQRVALQDLFQWVEIEVTSSPSVIPDVIRQNMARATEAYDGGGLPPTS